MIQTGLEGIQYQISDPKEVCKMQTKVEQTKKAAECKHSEPGVICYVKSVNLTILYGSGSISWDMSKNG